MPKGAREGERVGEGVDDWPGRRPGQSGVERQKQAFAIAGLGLF